MSFNLMSTKNQGLEHSFKQNSNVSQLTLMGYHPTFHIIRTEQFDFHGGGEASKQQSSGGTN